MIDSLGTYKVAYYNDLDSMGAGTLYLGYYGTQDVAFVRDAFNLRHSNWFDFRTSDKCNSTHQWGGQGTGW